MFENHHLVKAESPLLISVPHAGRLIPGEVQESLNETGLAQPDADHFVDRLYNWAPELGAGMLVASLSRYVIDLNRPPDDQPLYSTATTGLVPHRTFAGEPIRVDGKAVDQAEQDRRTHTYWRPYHEAIESELQRIRARFGHAVLLDAHSIASRVPRLFEGLLPDLNLGTHGGASADPGLAQKAWAALDQARFSRVVNGRFKGGYITRHYGRPDQGVHALQLELAQSTYMDETGAHWDPERAGSLREVLRDLVQTLQEWSPGD